MKRLRIITVALLAAAAAPAAIAQTQSANSDTAFSSHGDPQPAQNSGSTSATKKATAGHRRHIPRASAGAATSTPPNTRPDLNNMTANTH